MSDTRLSKMLFSLTPAEKRDFDLVMESVKRKTLKKLYKLILSNKQLIENKEVLFSKLFDREYSHRHDFKIRHELRLLTDKIKDFLIARQADIEGRENESWADYLLQRSLIRHQLYKEYEAEFKKAYKRTLDNLNYDMAQKMLNQYFNYLMTQPKIAPKMIEEAHEVLLDNLQNIKYRYRTDLAINQQGRVAMEAFLKSFGKPMAETTVGLDTDLKGHENPYIRFFEYSARAISSSGEEKIKYARLAAENIGEVEGVFPKIRVDGLAMLAGAYYVSRDYEKAAMYYQQAIIFKDKHKLPIRNDILFNYVSTLMKLEHYSDAIELMETHDKSIQSNPKVKHKFDYFHCMAHIFTGDHKKAKGIIPQNIGKLPEDEHHYFRFIYCILPYLEGDIEAAVREAGNYIAYFNHHGEGLAFPHEKGFAQAFKSFYEVMENKPNKSQERYAALEKVNNTIDALVTQYPQYEDYLYVKWLKDEIAKAG